MRVPAKAIDGRALEIDQREIRITEQRTHGAGAGRSAEPPADGWPAAEQHRRPVIVGEARRPMDSPRPCPVGPCAGRSTGRASRRHRRRGSRSWPDRTTDGRAPGGAGTSSGQRGEVPKATVPEQVEAIDGEGVHVRRHLIRREQAERSGVGVDCRADPRRGWRGRSGHRAGREHAPVDVAPSCQRGLELRARDARRRRPEAHDRHDTGSAPASGSTSGSSRRR